MSDKKQYVVMVEGRNAPSRIWNNYQQAEDEAKRLCIKEKLTAYVCEAITKIELNDVIVTKLNEQ
jgi:hypothetical protein